VSHASAGLWISLIIQSMLARLGKPAANVRVLQDPHMRRVNEALNREIITQIVDRSQLKAVA